MAGIVKSEMLAILPEERCQSSVVLRLGCHTGEEGGHDDANSVDGCHNT